MDFFVFKTDEKTNAAVERKLLVLSEAARRLGDDAEKLCPNIPCENPYVTDRAESGIKSNPAPVMILTSDQKAPSTPQDPASGG